MKWVILKLNEETGALFIYMMCPNRQVANRMMEVMSSRKGVFYMAFIARTSGDEADDNESEAE